MVVIVQENALFSNFISYSANSYHKWSKTQLFVSVCFTQYYRHAEPLTSRSLEKVITVILTLVIVSTTKFFPGDVALIKKLIIKIVLIVKNF